MDGDIDQAIEMVMVVLTTYGLSVVGAIVTLIVGWILARWLSARVRGVLARIDRVDPMLRGFFASLVKYAILAITVVAVLNQFGVAPTSLIAVMGAAGLAIGLALQGTLSNLAAGVMLLLFRPFKIGDFVEIAGLTGSVKAIDLFTTELATLDNVKILAPNAQIWGQPVTNYSVHQTRRADLVIGIDYGDDIDLAFRVLNQRLAADTRVLQDPAPLVAVTALNSSSVDILVRFWCASSDFLILKFDLMKSMKEDLDAAGITIPFPQSVLHQAPARDDPSA